MRVIFLNWRDRTHPRSGGAEVLAQGLATRLASAGHDVTFYCARVAGQPDDAEIDGVKVVRRGGRYSVYSQARAWLRAARPAYDLLIDHINTVPFFTPLYDRTRAVALVPQLARDVWWYEVPALVAPLGMAAERAYHTLYRNTPAITISRSTKEDLRRFGWRAPIRVISMPVAAGGSELWDKHSPPALLFVGRLTPSKRVEQAIDAFAVVRARIPGATLWIAGSADDTHYERMLHQRSQRVGGVEFLGHIDDVQRRQRMGTADMLLVTSVREGWGLVVTEANAVGTPAAGYDVAGLRDSIKPGQGLLVPPGDARALGTAVADLLLDRGALAHMAARARADAAYYGWDRTYAEFVDALRALRPDLKL
ncbi:MAG: glycosyltransferase family 4 protein [Candidatus Eremiobacteraeota bacterium]|nr:glycosyltransferase family 4 protein [Candidatus Eremiobacteraeota bacterium]